MKIYWNGKSKNIIGNKLKKLRKNAGLTQKALAEKLQLEGCEFSDLTILRIERGDRFVPDYELLAIAKFFNISTDELLSSYTIANEGFVRIAEQKGNYSDSEQTLDDEVRNNEKKE